MPRSSLLARATTALGLVGAAVVPATAATAQDPPPPARPPADDRFAGLPVSAEVSAPTFAAGTVGIAGSSTRTAPARTRVDVYRTPGPEQAPVPFAWALTDANGRFDLRALPGPLDDGQLHTLTAVVSTPGGAAVTSRIQVTWDRAPGQWARTEVGPRDEAGPASTRSIARGAGLRIDVPDIPQSSAAPATKEAAATPSACRPIVQPGAIIRLDGANITTTAFLVQPKLDAQGRQAETLLWELDSVYRTGRTTYVENVDNVSLKANFSATYKGVTLGISGERALVKTTGSGTDIGLENGNHLVTNERFDAVYGLNWRAWGQVYECIDVPRTYALGRTVYGIAYLGLELADVDQTDPIRGQSIESLHRLDIDPATKKYVRPCGASSGGKTYAVQPGAFFKRSTGTSQSFENGMTFKLGGSISSVVGGEVQGERTRSERSRVQTGASSYTSWKNRATTRKYLCGYDARPSDPNNDPGFVVALGADQQ